MYDIVMLRRKTMGEVKWTKEQSLAINEKGQNILVAAAARKSEKQRYLLKE